MVEHGGAELVGSKSFDFVFANINLNILLNDMSAYANVMHSGSKIIFSGFYTSDLEDIQNSCEGVQLEYVSHLEKQNWVAAKFSKI